MAKSKKPSTKYSKPKTSIFLCCFGSPLPKKENYDPIPKQKKTSWFSWTRIRFNKNSASKTVPLEASLSVKAHDYKLKSKSTPHHKHQSPASNPPPTAQQPSVLPVTPYHTPSQTRHGANSVEDTRQQGRASPAQPKRQVRAVSSSMQKNQTTSKRTRGRSNDTLVGMSVVVVTLVIMIFWGRFCAILCTSAWLYFIPRFRKSATVNDDDDPNTKSINDVDLDSKLHKKKVIMEGLLERNHRGTL
ncbi:uncharacterized protein At5g23160 [Gastrolobium bilobum]|uniref:uncharacterized protein At5g23160 n=1 Tax=Gastrolobium bilobum TaxID=150636 RepID=UPI002AB2BF60|nr:uncharacterized protein At5g23160 [Gastrolobium bilobum]